MSFEWRKDFQDTTHLLYRYASEAVTTKDQRTSYILTSVSWAELCEASAFALYRLGLTEYVELCAEGDGSLTNFSQIRWVINEKSNVVMQNARPMWCHARDGFTPQSHWKFIL
jgi:hypothetical protein